jgi:hypothetical protein
MIMQILIQHNEGDACSTSSPMNAWRSVSPARLKAIDVIDVLSDLFILRGVPAHIRSDNGQEFVAKAVQEWIAVVGAKPPTSSGAARGRTATSRASNTCTLHGA